MVSPDTGGSRSRFPYLVDENFIARTQGCAVPPLRVFNLQGLGIPPQSFLEFMRNSFSLLGLDQYDPKRNRIAFLLNRFPDEAARLSRFLADYYDGKMDLDGIADLAARLSNEDRHEFNRIGLTYRRKRSIARFKAARLAGPQNLSAGAGWDFTRVGAREFRQKVGPGDARALVRKFGEAHEFVTDYPPLRTLMGCLADMVLELEPHARVLEMNFHQMFIFADLMSKGDNSPEGTHQDGADYIVSALVIERAGILGGESIVYALDKQTVLLRRTLAEGEGIFQADKDKLWHYVTPIAEDPTVPPDFGSRSILGFDIDIVG